MLGYLIRRVLLFIPTLWVAVSIVFVIFRLIPGDPAQLAAGESAPESVIETIRTDMGLDKPIYVQYVRYLEGVSHGDFGTSRVYQTSAMNQIFDRLPATIKLAGAAMLIAVVIGVGIGVVSAIRPSSALDYGSMLFAISCVSLPGFWLGLMLIILFSVKIDIFPVAGDRGFLSIVLPAVTLAANHLAILARITRSSMLGVLSEDYVRTARAKGLREGPVIVRHALRNALIPTITVAGLQLGYLLGGSLVVETVFAWPGLGRLMIDSIQQRDFAMIQAIVVVFAVLMMLVNLLVDVLYRIVDPRVNYG